MFQDSLYLPSSASIQSQLVVSLVLALINSATHPTGQPLSTPKITPKGLKRPHMRPIKKGNDRAVIPKPKLIVYISWVRKNVLNLSPSTKIALKGPKMAKMPKIEPN